MKKTAFIMLILSIAIINSCRNDDYVIYSQTQDTNKPTTPSRIMGMYVLNEGNMGHNKATVDYLDLSNPSGTVYYTRNIYSERNPKAIKELGDVGNDIKIYGSKLWMVINASNKVEVATADSCKRITQINIPNCRYIAFKDKFAYITSYVGPIRIDPSAPLGMVYKVDTTNFKKVDSLAVGYQPEELCIVDNKLYVANSGGYRVPDYDQTVSEINLDTFKEIRKINVAINLHRCKADKYGQVWVTSRGDYNQTPSRIYWLSKDNNGTMQLAGHIDTPVSEMCIVGDSLYYYGTQWNETTFNNTISYGIINIKTHQQITTQLSKSAQINSITIPYGIIVNPIHRDFYLMDAKNYVSSGELLHFNADGTFDYSVRTGDIPGHATFVYK